VPEPALPPQYSPKDVEERLYAEWESSGVFVADPQPKRAPYTIVIPPPNVTGILHMGHALNNTIQDILIRYQGMRGKNALWVPGTDHAGIATQNVVERALAKEGKTRQDLGRDAFIRRVWAWKEEYGNTIIHQLKRLGASCDWRRTRFTMDEGLSDAVLEVFVRLYQKGLIYRGTYIINWCPRCQTALSDEEAPRKETKGKLYHIRYPLAGKGERGEGTATRAPRPTPPVPAFIEVATTRPETMLGDTAVAVHPKDPRYKKLTGRFAVLPLVGRKLSIIADDAVDREFGTGAVKVTPAHDPVDFQLGKKHRLEFVNVMTDDARMTNVPKAYEGLDRYECRSKLIVDLEQAGVLGGIDEHLHNVGHCYRCDTTIEPRLSPQWFVKMEPLARPAIRAVKDGTIRFTPQRWTKVYLNWMENIQDWCISRQIWWGHRLPVYYCQNCTGRADHSPQSIAHSKCIRTVDRGPRTVDQRGVIVSKTPPAKCPTCGSTDVTQDEDVLDTWFSSWLWPFSTLGWPRKTKDLAYFYPTDTLVTAPEIIFFWVARMIMAGYFCMGRPPFRNVYIHGTVRDITGRKMSKSLGNIIDPLEIIEQYGTDALRYTLVTATAVGQDVFLAEERFAAGRNFANKLWNVARYVLAQKPAGSAVRRRPVRPVTVADRWILSRLQRTIERVTKSLDAFELNEAANSLYDFVWHDFCDWYVEVSKIQLSQAPAIKEQERVVRLLRHLLETSVRLLHPFMPFVTEELWRHLGGETNQSLMRQAWPKPSKSLHDASADRSFEQLKAVIGAIRNTRAELNVPPDRRPAVRLVAKQAAVRRFFDAHRGLLEALARTGEITLAEKGARPKHAAATIVDGIEVIMPLEGLIDIEKERARGEQRVKELTSELARVKTRLTDRQFTRKAPKEVVEQAKARRGQLEHTLKKVSEHVAVLRSM